MENPTSFGDHSYPSTPSQLDKRLQKYEQIFKFLNNVSHMNLSNLFVSDSESVLGEK